MPYRRARPPPRAPQAPQHWPWVLVVLGLAHAAVTAAWLAGYRGPL